MTTRKKAKTKKTKAKKVGLWKSLWKKIGF